MNPDITQIGQWVLIVVLIIPAAKVIHDWLRPPSTQILPQPLGIKIAEDFCTKHELKLLKTDIDNQITEIRAYLHKSVHDFRDDMQSHYAKSDESREAIHRRIEQVFAAIVKEGHRVDSRVNDVAKAVDRLTGAFENDQSQRRRSGS